MKAERIAVIIDAMTLGGAQQIVLQLAQHWNASGHQVLVVVMQGGSRQLISALEQERIEFVNLNATNMFDFRNLFYLYRLLSVFNPTQIHAHLYWSQAWTSILFLFKRVRLLKWVEHNTYINRSTWQWLFYRLLGRRVAGIIAVSSEVQEFVKFRSGLESITINNPIAGKFHSTQRNLNFPKFVLAGRLVLQKNPILAVKSFDLALKSELIPPESTLLIIGDGPLVHSLQEEVLNSGIHHSVIFFGAVDRTELLDMLATCTTLISTSVMEGDPLVRLEGLASGCMVVSTTTGGISETPSGVLKATANEKDIAKALSESLRTKYWSEDAINARREFLRYRTIESIAQRYLDSFNNTDSSD